MKNGISGVKGELQSGDSDSSTSVEQLQAEFSALALLENGWDGDGSVAISKAALAFAQTLTSGPVANGELGQAHASGRPDGGVCLRWRVGLAFFDLVVEPDPDNEVSVIAMSGKEETTVSVYNITGSPEGIGESLKGIIETGVAGSKDVGVSEGGVEISRPKTVGGFWYGFWHAFG